MALNMSITSKFYKRRQKLYKRPAHIDMPRVIKEGKHYWFSIGAGHERGPYKTWGDAEVARQAYWERQA